MPERLNLVHQLPSSQIVFIKPLPGPDSTYAQDFLERIAAICHPIMKSHHLRITTLEEHEPNREFIGRNFNAGEIIQLVLKAQHTGRWLSFRSVQMVMMHELAHCLQMNHGRDFWKVNAGFKNELRALWEKGYTGDGLWGQGRTLLSRDYDRVTSLADEVLPQNLCGGAYRSRRRRKRRRGLQGAGPASEETSAEKKQKRIAKKFGVNGVTLGGDEATRERLEYGNKVKGNPRVANSGRGRELRIAAALARFGQQKEEEAKEERGKATEESTPDDDNITEEDYEDEEEGSQTWELDGSVPMNWIRRGGMQVSKEEDQDDELVKRELQELQDLEEVRPETKTASGPGGGSINPSGGGGIHLKAKMSASKDQPRSEMTSNVAQQHSHHKANQEIPPTADIVCPVCSLSNDPFCSLCAACSHVLVADTWEPTKYWHCQSETCSPINYINSADRVICAICGTRKSGAD